MSEKRKPCLSVLVKIPGKKETTIKVELFHASEWGARSFLPLFRTRVNGSWDDPKSGKKFRSPAGIFKHLRSTILNQFLPKKESNRITPDMVPMGTRIRLFDSSKFYKDNHETRISGYVRSIPFVDQDGEWAVYMTGGKVVRLYEIDKVLENGR